MVSMKEMNSAGGFELLTLQREPKGDSMVELLREANARCARWHERLQAERLGREQDVAQLTTANARIASQGDLNIRLAAHIIDQNGKIIELESQLKTQGEMTKAAIEAARTGKPQTLPWDAASIKADENLREMIAAKKAQQLREAAKSLWYAGDAHNAVCGLAQNPTQHNIGKEQGDRAPEDNGTQPPERTASAFNKL